MRTTMHRTTNNAKIAALLGVEDPAWTAKFGSKYSFAAIASAVYITRYVSGFIE
jgi:hypothetical protein